LNVTRSCEAHGETAFILDGRGHYRCKRCRAEAVARRRRKLKTILIAEAGGRCSVCGYDRLPRAFEFHHLNPREKRLEISRNGVTLSLGRLRAEAKKCVLLCSNCHAEVGSGFTTLPLH
jgi:5-methylcytosine-specific restriction endonuclease McrA